jgi:hypothetical protein
MEYQAMIKNCELKKKIPILPLKGPVNLTVGTFSDAVLPVTQRRMENRRMIRNQEFTKL